MTYPPYMREKARKLRREKQLTIDEIADRLAVSRTTVYFWVGDMPRPKRCLTRKGPGHTLGNQAMQAKYKRLRDEAYQLGRSEFERLDRRKTFRDFVSLYIAEGFKRNRNCVSIANSDPAVMKLAVRWMRQFSTRPLDCGIQFHADQDLAQLTEFWGRELGVDPDGIRLQRKSNSNQLRGRNWRSEHGVLTVRVNDTMFRSRLQGWIDSIKEQWLDSPDSGA
jgi:transcriptional regulator with XRE-family HTH domain